MTETQATLLAAAIAAFVSFVNLLLQIRTQEKKEQSQSTREMLNEDLREIQDNLHTLLAQSNIMITRVDEGQTIDAETETALTAKKKLNEIRPKIRYALFGMDDALRDLTLLPDRISNYCVPYPNHTKKFFKTANNLKEALDRAIFTIYRTGSPTLLQKISVAIFHKIFKRQTEQLTSEPIVPDDIQIRIKVSKEPKIGKILKRNNIQQKDIEKGISLIKQFESLSQEEIELETQRRVVADKKKTWNGDARNWINKIDFRVSFLKEYEDEVGRRFAPKNNFAILYQRVMVFFYRIRNQFRSQYEEPGE